MVRFFLPLIIFLTLLMGLISCDKESEGVILDERQHLTYKKYDIYKDKHGNMGVVISVTTKRILVMSADEGVASWGEMGKTLTPHDTVTLSSQGNSFGLSMLQSMKTAGIEHYPAQKWCDDKNCGDPLYGGSWRLPTYREYSNYINKTNFTNINKALSSLNAPLLTSSFWYWTCNEDTEGFRPSDANLGNLLFDSDNRAIPVSPVSTYPGNKDQWVKKFRYHVRAVKTIYYED